MMYDVWLLRSFVAHASVVYTIQYNGSSFNKPSGFAL